MKDSNSPATISRVDLLSKTNRYVSIIPETLKDLGQACRISIPETLAERKRNNDAFLNKDEVTQLMNWKLKHGKFRPSLPKLLASNSEQDISSTTRAAFAAHTNDPSDPPKALNTIVKLKGIGPATASLILSRLDPITIPFFSDELFRYVHFSTGAGKGWDRKISYSMKEYKSLLDNVSQIRERLKEESGEDVAAEEVEMAAFVILREEKDGQGGGEEAVLVKVENDAEGGGMRKGRGKRMVEESGAVDADVGDNRSGKKGGKKKRRV